MFPPHKETLPKNKRHEQRKNKIERLQRKRKATFPLFVLLCLLYSCLIESVTRKDKTTFIHFFLQAFANASLNKRLLPHRRVVVMFVASL
jgi:ABC-type microcin C transport system permease subunit YejE